VAWSRNARFVPGETWYPTAWTEWLLTNPPFAVLDLSEPAVLRIAMLVY
jgi:hypothetical protein